MLHPKAYEQRNLQWGIYAAPACWFSGVFLPLLWSARLHVFALHLCESDYVVGSDNIAGSGEGTKLHMKRQCSVGRGNVV